MMLIPCSTFYSKIIQDLLRIQDVDSIFKFPFQDYPRFTKIPRYWFSKMIPYQFSIPKLSNIHKDCKISNFPRFNKIPRSSKITQDFQELILRFVRHLGFPTFGAFQNWHFRKCVGLFLGLCKVSWCLKG